jgi:hypothetical protein
MQALLVVEFFQKLLDQSPGFLKPRIRAHPSLRVPRQSLARFSLSTIETTAVR